MITKEKSEDSHGITRLKRVMVCGKVLCYSPSFDISRYDGGAFWLQIHDEDKGMAFDEVFAAPWGEVSAKQILERIREELPLMEWPL